MMSQLDGVVVPPELCRALSRLASIGVGVLTAQSGGLPVAPGLARVLAELDRSAGGRALPTMAEPSWLAAGEAAQLTGTSARHVRRLAGAGRIRARKTGRDWQIERQAAEDYGRKRRCRTPP